jgi:WD40 repeat protein
MDGTLRIWDHGGKIVPRVLHSSINALSADGNVYSSKNDTNLEVYLTASPDAPKTRIAISGKLRGTFLSDEGDVVAMVTEESARNGVWCQLWLTDSSPDLLARFQVPDRSSRVAFDHNRESLVVMSARGTEKVTFGSGACQSWPLLTNVAASNAVFSADNRSVALMAGPDVFVFDFEQRRLRFERLQHRITVRDMAFSPDGKLLLICTGNNEVQACSAQVWDVATGTPVGPQRWHADGVDSAAWFPDSRRFITVGEDGVGQFWSVLGDAPIKQELKHDHEIESVQMGSASGLILTSSQDLTTRLWDQESAYPIGPPVRFPRELQSVLFSGRDAQVVAHDLNSLLFLTPNSSVEWSQPILAALAHVLDGRLPTPVAGDEFQTGKAYASEWQRLKGDLGAYFKVSSEQIVAWHRMEAEQCRTTKHRRGELFHLNHLLRLVPDDRYLISRREHVLEVLAAESDSPPNRN